MTANEILKALADGRELQLDNKYIGALVLELGKLPGGVKVAMTVNEPKAGVTTLRQGYTVGKLQPGL